MAEPSMETIKASLERCFKNWSLNNDGQQESSTTTTTGDDEDSPEIGDPTLLELNSDTSLPFHWEQCLDLKTGEIYYINWRTGMKAKQDPRRDNYYYYSSEDDDESVISEDQWSPASSSKLEHDDKETCCSEDNCKEEDDYNNNNNNIKGNHHAVLVVSGCKSCFTFHMVPKQLEICPKCCGQLMQV